MTEITRILASIGDGNAQAAEELLPLVYSELRRLAAHRMAHEAPGQTLQATALVHEAWLRLAGGGNSQWQGRTHFFGAAAEAMRRILIEKVRRKHAQRHGAGKPKVDLDEIEVAAPTRDDELLLVSEALEKFAARDQQKAELVKLRYFVGVTIEEAADILGISVATANRWWNYSRAWLAREIEIQQQG